MTDVNRHLGRVWAGNQIGCAEQIEEFLARQPLAAADDLVLHHRDVRCRTAKCGGAEFKKQYGNFEQWLR
jgi:hypothetical protein